MNDTLLQYQNIVDIALSTGWAKLPKLPHMMALNFFNGLHVLARQFASNGRLRPLRDVASSNMGEFSFSLPLRPGHTVIEDLPVGDRGTILSIVSWVLDEWPYRYIEICKQARVSGSYLGSDDRHLPYWLSKELRWDLLDTDRHVSPEEWASAKKYLADHGLDTCKNNIRRWLGLHHAPYRRQAEPFDICPRDYIGHDRGPHRPSFTPLDSSDDENNH